MAKTFDFHGTGVARDNNAGGGVAFVAAGAVFLAVAYLWARIQEASAAKAAAEARAAEAAARAAGGQPAAVGAMPYLIGALAALVVATLVVVAVRVVQSTVRQPPLIPTVDEQAAFNRPGPPAVTVRPAPIVLPPATQRTPIGAGRPTPAQETRIARERSHRERV